jgi:hypothetical protein
MINRLELIKKLACKVQADQLKLAGIERQAVMLSDLEYVTVSKVDTKNNELNFN